MESRIVKILAIDDNSDNLISIEALVLEAFPDAMVFTAISGTIGLDIAAKEDPDLILLDIVMPRMDGYEVCRKFKADNNLSGIPVVFVTALKGDKESRIRALEVGAEAFLAKPIDETELTAQIRAMVKIKTANIEKRDKEKLLTELVKVKTLELQTAHAATLNMMDDLKKENDARIISEEALQKDEERFRNISASISDLSFSCKVDANGDSIIDWIYGSCEKITGYSNDELVSMKCWGKIVVEEDFHLFKKHILEVKPGLSDNCQLRIKNKTGNMVWIHASSKCIKQQDSDINLLFGGIIDITERKLIEEKTRKLSTAVEQSSASIVITDFKGDIEYVNPKFTEVTGYSFQEAVGQNPRILKSGITSDQEYSHLWKTISSGSVWNGEFSNKKKNGEFYWESASISPIVDESGVITHYVAVKEDITKQKLIQEQLKESEEKHRLLIENSHDIIYTLDKNGIFTFASAAWTKLLGHSIANVIGKSYQEFVHPEDIPNCIKWLQNVFETGRSEKPAEYRVQHLDGTWRWHISSGVALSDINGVLTGYQGIAKDVTDRKLAEDALKESEEKYSKAFQTSPYAISITRPSDGKFIEFNENFENISGYTRQEILADSSIGLNMWADVNERDMVISAIFKGSGISGREFRFKRKNGEIIVGLFSAQLIEIKNESYILSSINDITERKLTDLALKASEDKYRLLVYNQRDLLVKTDQNGQILYVNPAYCELFDKKEEELLGSFYTPEVHPEDQQNVENAFKLLYKSPYECTYEVRSITKHGWSWLSWVAKSVLDENNEVSAIIGSCRDITERKLAEEIIRLSDEKFHALYSNMNEGAALHQLTYNEQGIPEDYVIVEVNPTFENILGLERDSVVGKTSRDIYNVKEPPYFDIYSKVALTGEPASFETYFAPFSKYFSISVYCPFKGSFATIFDDISERKLAEQAVEKIGKHYQALIEKAPDGVVLLNAEGNFKFISPSTKKMFKFELSDEIHGSPADYTHPDDLPMVLTELGKIFADPSYIPTIQYRYADKNGKWRWIESVFSNLLADPNVESIVINFRDINDRKLAEEQLSIANERYNLALKAGSFGVWDRDVQNNVLVWDDRMYELYGLKRKEFEGAYEAWLKCIHPEDAERCNQEIQDVLNGTKDYNTEFRIVLPNGSIKNIQAYGYVVRNQSGIPLRLTGINYDITASKQAEKHLQESEERYRIFINSNEDMTFLKDENLRYRIVNKAQALYFNMESYDILGKTDFELMTREVAQICNMSDKKALSSDVVVVSEEKVADKIYETHKFRVPLPGNTFGVGGYIIDITKRKRSELLIDALNRAAVKIGTEVTVDDIFNTVSSELKTLDFSCMLLPIDDTGTKLFTKFLDFDSKTLRLIEKTVGIKQESFMMDINEFDEFKKVVYDHETILVKDTTMFLRKALPRSVRMFAGEIIKLMKIPKNILAPLIIENKVVGVFSVQSNDLSEHDVPAIKAFAMQMASAWYIADLFQNLNKNLEILEIAEKELLKSEERFKQVAEIAGEWIWEIDTEGQYTYASKMSKSILGYDADEIVGKKYFYDFFDPSVKEESKKAAFAYFKRREVFRNFENTNIHKDGSKVTMLTNGLPIYNDKGKFTGYRGVDTDITKRKIAEEKLIQSEQKFREMANSLPVTVYETDISGNITFANEITYEWFGYNAEEIESGINIFKLIDESNHERVVESIKQIIKTGIVKTGEYLIAKKNGDTIPALISSGPILKNGEIIGLRGTVVDISKLKQAEEALLESEEIFNSFMDFSPIYVFFKDHEARPLRLSKNFENMLGMPVKEMLGKTMDELFPSKLSKSMIEDDIGVIRNNMPIKIEEELEGRIYETTKFPIHIPGKDTYLAGYTIDITESKKAEIALTESREQLKNFALHLQNIREEEKKILSREIHDDLGQILVAVKIDVGLLKQKIIKSIENGETTEILTKMDSLFILVDKTIKTTRKIMSELRPEILEMIGFVETIKLHAKEFQDRYQISCQVNSELPNLEIDSQQSVALFRIFQEGLTNVARHSMATEVKINLSTNNNKLIMEIIDNGVGFDKNRKHKPDSYGLIGMRERAYLLEGELNILANSGKGTCIRIEIPYLK